MNNIDYICSIELNKNNFMQSEVLKQVISEQRANVLKKPMGVLRDALKLVENKLQLPHIIVITGIRRCGKSTLLRQIIQQYYNNTDFYYINFEDERLLNFNANDFNNIYETLVELYGEKTTFLIDEIQNVDNFDSFVRRFYDLGFKFIITGSNARLLSKEISTKLTGRHTDIYIQPFSFLEYLQFADVESRNMDIYISENRSVIKKHFNDWLVRGGMPEYVKFDDLDIINRIYDDIVLKDIVARYKVENVKAIRELYSYLISNFANRYSYNSLNKFSSISSVATTQRFIHYFQESFIGAEINKFDYSYRKQMINEKKIYIVDNGLITAISTRLTTDKGWLLENAVYNILSTFGNIFYFSNKNECDFIVQNYDKTISAFQVCYDFNTHNREREIKGIKEAMDFFDINNSIILTSDYEELITLENKKTIIILPVWKWILEKRAIL
jgi:predicted AAA+ superfamily ATPase